MNRHVVLFLRFLGKVQFTMILLLGGILAMAVGTVIESREGTDEAWSAVYGTFGFDVFLFLICVNLIGAVVNRIPIRRNQWAFVVTHASIVLLLVGAWMSRELGYEGVVAIEEKSESNTLNLRVAELEIEWATDRREVLPLGRVPHRGPLALESADAPALQIVDIAQDSEFGVRLGEGESTSGPGVELQFSGKGWDRPEWLIAEHPFFRRKDLGSMDIEMLVARSAETLEEWLPAREDTSTVLTVKAGKNELRISLPEDLGRESELGNTRVTVTEFLERARVVGQKVQHSSDAAINPAAIVKIENGDRTEVHTVFSQFPKFNVVKGREGAPLVTSIGLRSAGVGEKPMVRIIMDPDTDRHWVQIAVAKRRGEAWPLEEGKPVVLGGLGMDVTLKSTQDHAKPVVELRPARRKGSGSRWIKVVTENGGETAEGWIEFGARHVLETAGGNIALTYRPTTMTLPFSIALRDFEVDYHGGSRMAAQYTSHIAIRGGSGGPTEANISMNSPLDHEGFRMFQSSYDLGENGRPDTTYLSVSYDPGVPLVYVSFVLLILGVSWYLRSHAPRREGQEAESAPPAEVVPMPKSSRSAVAYAITGAILLLLIAGRAVAQKPTGQSATPTVSTAAPDLPYDATRAWAIQSGGRIKPLDTRARELIVSITGKRKIDGYGPLAFLWAFHFAPDRVRSRPWIRVDSQELKKAMGLDVEGRRFSFDEIFQNEGFRELVEGARKRDGASEGQEISQVGKDALATYEKLEWVAGIMEGTALTFFPTSRNDWASLADMQTDGSETARSILHAFQHLGSAYRSGDTAAFSKQAAEFGRLVRESSGEAYPEAKTIDRELLYHDLNAYGWAWIVYLLSVFPLVLFQKKSSRLLARSGIGLLALGLVLHTTGILLRWAIAGRAPVSDMYESLVFMSWGVVFIGLLLELVHGGKFFSLSAAIMGAISLMFAEFLPLDSGINPLVPVLAHTAWLSIHVMTIMLSYSAFVLAMALGHIVIFVQLLRPGKTERLRYLSSLLYRTVQVGLVFLTAGIAFGAIWANESWGRYWGWDPKETWSLITFFVYLAIVHARFAGWLHNFGLAVASIVGFLSVLMTYYGVNFVLASGLHSYGFSTGGTIWLVIYLAGECAVIGWATVRHRKAVARAAETPLELVQPDAAGS